MRKISILVLFYILINCGNDNKLIIEVINPKEHKRIMENERLNAIQFFKLNHFEQISDSTFLKTIKNHSIQNIDIHRLLKDKNTGFHQQYYRDHLFFNDSREALDLMTENGGAGMGQLEGEVENLIVRISIFHCDNNIFCREIVECKEGVFYRNIVKYNWKNKRKKIMFDYCDVLELHDGKMQVIDSKNKAKE